MHTTSRLSVLSAVMQAFRLGLRDTFTLRAIGSLAALWSISTLLWLVVFLVLRAEIWHAMQSLAQWAATLGFGSSSSGNNQSVGAVGGGTGAVVKLVVGMTLGAVSLVMACWICVLLTVRIAMELLLMRFIRAQALHAYPHLGAATAAAGDWRLSWHNTLGPWLGAALVVPVFLLMPFVGGPLLAAFLAYLNVRTLVNDAFDGMAGATELRAFVAAHRGHMLLLGGLLALLVLVPLVGFLLPWVTGSAVCHLVLRSRGEALLPIQAAELPR